MQTGNEDTALAEEPPVIDTDDWGDIDTTPKLSVVSPSAGLRSHILTYDDVTWDLVDVPEWGDVTLLVRSGTGDTRADLLDAAISIDERTEKTSVDLKKIYPDLVIHSVIDPTTVPGVTSEELLGTRLATDKVAARRKFAAAVGNAPTVFSLLDRGGLLAKNGAALEKIGKVASKLWGLDKEAEKVAEKNSNATPNVEPI